MDKLNQSVSSKQSAVGETRRTKKKCSCLNLFETKCKHSHEIQQFIYCMLFALLLFFIVILTINFTENRQKKCVTEKNKLFKLNKYDIIESNKTVKKTISLLFIEDEINDEYYNFESGKNECLKINSTIWEISDGQPEWEVVTKFAKKEKKESIWLNAKQTNYEYPNESDGNQKFKEDIPVIWPSFPNSNYSRLRFKFTSEKQCVYINNPDILSNTSEYIWRTSSCTAVTAWVLCVKRNKFC